MNIITRTFKDTAVRVIDRNGQIWFVASDIAKALNYPQAKDMTRVLDDDERGRHIVPTPSGDTEMVIINESGLYHALIKSRKPEAIPFRKWVTGEVLPAIRKTGHYEKPESRSTPAAIPSAARLTRRLKSSINRKAHEMAQRHYTEINALFRDFLTEDVIAMLTQGETEGACEIRIGTLRETEGGAIMSKITPPPATPAMPATHKLLVTTHPDGHTTHETIAPDSIVTRLPDLSELLESQGYTITRTRKGMR